MWPGPPLLVITQHQVVVLVITALLPGTKDAETSHTLHYFVQCNSQFLEHKKLFSTSQILSCRTLHLNYKRFGKSLRIHSSKIHNKSSGLKRCSVVGEQHCFGVTFCVLHNDRCSSKTLLCTVYYSQVLHSEDPNMKTYVNCLI